MQRQIGGRRIDAIQLRSPFLVRTFEPKLDTAVGRRIVWALEDDLFLVIHLMIADRFHWKKTDTRPTWKIDLAAFYFDSGRRLLTEAGSKKRASLHVVDGESGLAYHDPGDLEVLEADLDAFTEVLKRRNCTLKRALTDPRLFSGIGNAYSDEILHAARLSPVKWTSRLSDEEVASLYAVIRSILTDWCTQLQAEGAFPEKVTAFRPEMAVHGRYGKPCPVCATAVREIAYASNETNYYPRCQIKGKVLADRQLSRMLKDDWPKTIEDLEAHRGLTSPDDA